MDFPWQVRIIELVRVADARMRNELQILAAEWLLPVVKFVNDILKVPPTLASK